MVYETLLKKRNDMAAEIRQLENNIIHLDATIKLFAPEYKKPKSKRGGVTRVILDILREAKQPMNTRDISAKAGIDMKRTGLALNAQQKRKLVKSMQGSDLCKLWEIIK